MALDVTQVRESAIHVASHPRTRKVAIWIAAIFVAIGVLLGLVAPPLLRGKIASTLSDKFHRQVSIEQIRFNPYTLTDHPRFPDKRTAKPKPFARDRTVCGCETGFRGREGKNQSQTEPS